MTPEEQEVRSLATSLMTDGRFKDAASVLHGLAQKYRQDLLLGLELQCALAAAGMPELAQSNLASYRPVKLSKESRARLLTAEAFIDHAYNQQEESELKLRRAVELDPSFPPSLNTLGRYLLYQHEQYDDARQLLTEVSGLVPQSLGPKLDLASLDVETRDFSSAFRRARLLVLEHTWDLRAWASLISIGILMLPWSGLPLGLLFSALVFIPYAGPIAFALWVIPSLGIPVLLRRVGGRLPVSAAGLLFPMTPAILLRWLLLGRLWP